MHKYTIEDVLATGPCWPHWCIMREFGGRATVTANDIATHDNVSTCDRIWLLIQLLPARERAKFLAWTARQVWSLIPEGALREGVIVAEEFASGNATPVQLHYAYPCASASYHKYASTPLHDMSTKAYATAHAIKMAYRVTVPGHQLRQFNIGADDIFVEVSRTEYLAELVDIHRTL